MKSPHGSRRTPLGSIADQTQVVRLLRGSQKRIIQMVSEFVVGLGVGDTEQVDTQVVTSCEKSLGGCLNNGSIVVVQQESQ